MKIDDGVAYTGKIFGSNVLESEFDTPAATSGCPFYDSVDIPNDYNLKSKRITCVIFYSFLDT